MTNSNKNQALLKRPTAEMNKDLQTMDYNLWVIKYVKICVETLMHVTDIQNFNRSVNKSEAQAMFAFILKTMLSLSFREISTKLKESNIDVSHTLLHRLYNKEKSNLQKYPEHREKVYTIIKTMRPGHVFVQKDVNQFAQA